MFFLERIRELLRVTKITTNAQFLKFFFIKIIDMVSLLKFVFRREERHYRDHGMSIR